MASAIAWIRFDASSLRADGSFASSLLRSFASEIALTVNGGLNRAGQPDEAPTDGADLTAFGKAALANRDFPKRLAASQPSDAFCSFLLGPIVYIKDKEIEN